MSCLVLLPGLRMEEVSLFEVQANVKQGTCNLNYRVGKTEFLGVSVS
jgi:hypothetical protein